MGPQSAMFFRVFAKCFVVHQSFDTVAYGSLLEHSTVLIMIQLVAMNSRKLGMECNSVCKKQGMRRSISLASLETSTSGEASMQDMPRVCPTTKACQNVVNPFHQVYTRTTRTWTTAYGRLSSTTLQIQTVPIGGALCMTM